MQLVTCTSIPLGNTQDCSMATPHRSTSKRAVSSADKSTVDHMRQADGVRTDLDVYVLCETGLQYTDMPCMH